jgi:multicomponent Na+:H+ antiporter subunit B
LKVWGVIVLLALAVVLLVAAQTLPPLRTGQSPVSQHLEPYYVARALGETGTPNLVTAILADYRSYDTFGETTVIFVAGLSCYLLLRRFHE